MAADLRSIPTDFDQLELSKWGLDWGDISLIRDQLKLTPTERLRSAQNLIDFASKYSVRGRGRPSQDRRNPPSSEPTSG